MLCVHFLRDYYGVRMKCSNCEADKLPSIYVTRSGSVPETVAILCEDCVKNVLMLKIVLARQTYKDNFAFDGYLPVKCL